MLIPRDQQQKKLRIHYSKQNSVSLKALHQYLELLKLSGIDDIFLPSKTEADNLIPSQKEHKQRILEELRESYKNCRKCRLGESRKNLVFGNGNADASLMLIGEGPGENEDKTGQVFVGRAGQLLTKMLKAINLEREEVYIANIVKCRPPGNRNPLPDERDACMPYLLEQIDIIRPQILVLLGGVAGHALLETTMSVGQMRKRVFTLYGIPTYVTYHPSALLRNESYKRPAWEDLKKIRDHYLALPAK